MNKETKLIKDDIIDLHSRINPDYDGDLTYQIDRAMLVIVRRLKVRLELLEAEFEKNN
jgi:hypothetical protein